MAFGTLNSVLRSIYSGDDEIAAHTRVGTEVKKCSEKGERWTSGSKV